MPIEMAMTGTSVQQAHDLLLANKPAGIVHDLSCTLCQTGAGATEKAKEDTPMGDEPKFNEAQVAAMSASAVERETAALRTQVETLTSEAAALQAEKSELSDTLALTVAERDELTNAVEVAQAATSAAESARDAVQGEFDAFRNGLTEMAELDVRRAERVERIKAAAPHLSEEYLADETRQARWAEMSDDQFGSLLEGYLESAAAALTSAERAAVEKASDKQVAIAEILAARRGPANDPKVVRETAAFSGGDEPTSKAGSSSLGQLWQKTGKLPAPANA